MDGQAAGGGGFLITLLPFIAMFAILYFLMIRPQQKRQRERNNMLRSLQKGDQVVTIGGLHGVIESIADDKIVLKAGEVKLTFDRSAVGNVIARAEKKAEEKKEGKQEG
ncbi:MAG: preprotein translocase subunit YajC [Paenibacillaceae bacterium ZCTH02-B3]|nr:MAG: preprotein translocase subunit YajC [Paenibacillaceae bacterium ZCTH02-B3]